MNKKKKLDTKKVSKEFNKRALKRNGIVKVLTNRVTPSINESFDKNCNQFIKENFPNKINNVIDVGIGIGRLSKYFTKKSKKLIGIDFSENMLEIAKTQFKNKNNVTLIHSNAADIDFLPNYFNLGIVSLVLKHNNDKNAIKVIKKMQKWCKKILLIEHVSGGTNGTQIAIVRTKSWYINHFKPMKPLIIHELKRKDDNIIFCIFK